MRLLVATAGDDEGDRALRRTLDRTRAGDSVTVAVLVADADDPESVAAAARRRLGEAGAEGTVRRLDGDPGPRLVEVAETEGFDRVVVGGGERSPMGKVEIGPVEEYVLLNSHVTVTVVR